MTRAQDKTDAQLAKVEDAMAADPDLARQAFTWKTLLAIIDTELVPKEYRGNVPKALAAILAGRERGLGPMLSMHYIDVIDGRGAPSGEYMVAKIFGAGHIVYASELTDTSCTAMGSPSDTPPFGFQGHRARQMYRCQRSHP